MVYAQCVNYFTGANISPFLLNERDIALLIHSYPSPPVNRMWADRKKSNYFSTGALTTPPPHSLNRMNIGGDRGNLSEKEAVTISK